VGPNPAGLAPAPPPGTATSPLPAAGGPDDAQDTLL
jgi:hypothetical protein